MDIINQLPVPLLFLVFLSVLSLIAFYAVVCAAINGHRKAFGKKPSFDMQMDTLRDEVLRRIAAHEAVVKARMDKHDSDDEQECASLRDDIKTVDRDVRKLRDEIGINGELRKQVMLNHIEDVRTKLDTKIDGQTTALNIKIDKSNQAQTATLIAALKGKHD